MDDALSPAPLPISIPIEIVSEEEMAFLEAALAAALPCALSPSSSSPRGRRAASSLSRCAAAAPPHSSSAADIEDSLATSAPRRSLLHRFRSKRALMVTDVTAAEWCEKQMEFVLLHGKPRRTKAMKAGSDRHAQLEKEMIAVLHPLLAEGKDFFCVFLQLCIVFLICPVSKQVIEKVDIVIKSVEESWAVKFMNFIIGANQLLFEGLTRELPVIGVVEGTWMIGVIDEIQLPLDKAIPNPIIVDTKTRHKATLPSEAQKRNARLQLMCYKYLWDSLTAEQFSTYDFFSYFNLNPQYNLSGVVKEYISSLGFHVKTLEDVFTYFRETCCLLPPSQEQLFLRYELQSDNSLLEEYFFSYDPIWFKDQVQECLKFWLGEREAKFVSEDEKWKCHFCKFTSTCPMTAIPEK
ncbi:Exonuclease V, chloroplastic [Ananas comosus]|uniref:Exonuclease V, chloroplastic n=1 Tax=Ananas comosus TaxID=4615 RepID=A0A199VYX4_ANACO|nr:Exonuclease V, chloroplastic [Ananas comosus]